jgi:hypothetical protein
MARFAASALAAALGLSTGCFVFEEIDQGREIMKRHSGQSTRRAAAAPTQAADPEPEAAGPGLLARVQAFLEERFEDEGPERDPSDEIVTCDLEDGLAFTYASDCLSRGGRVR